MLNPKRRTASELSGAQNKVGSPVSYGQPNFMTGGIILSMCFHHWVMDGGSINIVMVALADHVRSVIKGVTASSHSASLDRHTFNGARLAFTDIQKVRERVKRYNVMDATAPGTGLFYEPVPESLAVRLYRFQPGSINALKKACAVDSPKDIQFLSTHACVLALIWRAITRARATEHKYWHVKKSSTFFAVNMRKKDEHVLHEYIRNAFSVDVVNSLRLDELLDLASLPRAAVEIRKESDFTDLATLKDPVDLRASMPKTKRLDHAFTPTSCLDV